MIGRVWRGLGTTYNRFQFLATWQPYTEDFVPVRYRLTGHYQKRAVRAL